MNTLYFKYALEINKTGSITKAAENLYMQQPNLSKAVKELEESLGYQIFERTGKGMIPTAQGEIFISYAKEILDKIDELEMLSPEKNGGNSRFRISIPRGSYIANGFSEFVLEQSRNEEMDYSICETNSMQAIDNIVEHHFNLGIIRYAAKHEPYFMDYLESRRLQQEVIWEFEYVVVMSGDGPLAKKERVYLEDLEQLILLRHGDTNVPYYDAESALYNRKKAPGRKIDVFERGSQFDLLSHVKNTYMWVSPIPESYLERDNLVQRRCYQQDGSRGSELYKDVLIYRKGYELTELDRRFQKKLYESRIAVSDREYL